MKATSFTIDKFYNTEKRVLLYIQVLEGHGGSSRKKSSGLDSSSTSINTGTGSSGKIVSGHLHRDTERVSASESLNSVMGEELQLKIAENARLHAALDGVDQRYRVLFTL